MNKYLNADLLTSINSNTSVVKYGCSVGYTRVLIHKLDFKRVDVTDELEWNSVTSPDFIEDGILTLQEIYEQVKDKYGIEYKCEKYCPIIDVIEEGFRASAIYQCNNYKQGKWLLYGILGGFC